MLKMPLRAYLFSFSFLGNSWRNGFRYGVIGGFILFVVFGDSRLDVLYRAKPFSERLVGLCFSVSSGEKSPFEF